MTAACIDQHVLPRRPHVAPAKGADTLRSLAAVVRQIHREVTDSWASIPADRKRWLHSWATDELPQPNIVGRVITRFAAGLIYMAHPEAVTDFLTAGAELQQAILAQVAKDVWTEAQSEPAFATAYAQGLLDFREGKTVKVSWDDL